MLRQKIVIPNKLGLHARASAKLVHLSSRYGSHIEIIKDEQTVNGKSIMGVMMLAATKGTEVELSVEGEDENDVMKALIELIANKFGEEE